MSEEQEDDVSIEIHLKTAKVKGGKKDTFSMELVYDEVETDKNGKVSITPVMSFPPKKPHLDMFNALRRLVPHLVINDEFRPSSDFNKDYFKKDMAMKDATLNDFKVTGVHWKEKGDTVMVVLVGRKNLSSGRVINLNPTVNISNHEDGYVFSRELADAIEDYRSEVELYTEGKNGEIQGEMKFPDAKSEKAPAEPKAEKKVKSEAKKADDKEGGKGGMKVAV